MPPSTRLGVTRQEAYAFNQPLSLDTSSVTKMRGMFWVRPLRVPCPPCPAGSSVHAACTATAPTALPPLSPRVSSPLGRVVTRQEASAFNQPLSFDTSSVIYMFGMFCYDFLCELRGPAWSVSSCSSGPAARGILQILIIKTLRMTG